MSCLILNADCRLALSLGVADKSVQTCVTSPPYFGLRDYGAGGQIGLEASPNQYVTALVEVFREVHRVLRDDGTLWLNLGDSYISSGRGGDTGASGLQGTTASQDESKRARKSQTRREAAVTKHAGEQRTPVGLKQKELIGIPWRVAFALQADGWYLRQDIIWHKPNPMPESVRDRCTKAHEYIFLLTKNPRYYFDGDAIATPVKEATRERLQQQNLPYQAGSTRVPGKTNGPMKACFGGRNKAAGYGVRTKSGNEDDGNYLERGANKRSVWTVTTKPFKGAHFATFPQDLIEPCILAGSRPGDLVLDPFGGAGTTAVVAQKLGRDSVLCELNPEYVKLAEGRLNELR